MKGLLIIISGAALSLIACRQDQASQNQATEAQVASNSQTPTSQPSRTSPKPPSAAPSTSSDSETNKPLPKPEALQGRWSIHSDGLKQSAAFQKLPEAKQNLALAQLEQLKMDIVISADTITVHGQNGEDKLRESIDYTIAKQEGASFTIHTDKKGRGKTQVLTLRGEFLEVFEGGPKMIFKRVK